MRLAPALPVSLIALIAAPAFAQTSGPGAAPAPQPDTFDLAKDRITVALGVAYVPDYIGSNDYRVVPAPAAIGSIKRFNFTLVGNQLSVDLIREAPGEKLDLQFGPVVVLDLNRTSIKRISDPRVKALGEVKTGIELGGFVGIGKTGVITSPYDKLSVSVSYRHDVNGASNGDVVTPALNYLTPLSRKAAVGLLVSADYASGSYARTYFSVSPAQSLRSGLPVFTARSGWEDYTLGAFGTVALTGDLLHGLGLVVGGTYARQLNDFGATPLTSIAGSRNQWIGAAGLSYTF